MTSDGADLRGKVVLVTGGGKGVGRGISRRFLERGEREPGHRGAILIARSRAHLQRITEHEVRVRRGDRERREHRGRRRLRPTIVSASASARRQHPGQG